MSVSYDDALKTLEAMFDKVDRKTLISVLRSTDGHLERTVDILLAEKPISSNQTTENSSRMFRLVQSDLQDSNPSAVHEVRRHTQNSRVQLPKSFLDIPAHWIHGPPVTVNDDNRSASDFDRIFAEQLHNELNVGVGNARYHSSSTPHNDIFHSQGESSSNPYIQNNYPRRIPKPIGDSSASWWERLSNYFSESSPREIATSSSGSQIFSEVKSKESPDVHLAADSFSSTQGTRNIDSSQETMTELSDLSNIPKKPRPSQDQYDFDSI